jgi:hypothetical protein
MFGQTQTLGITINGSTTQQGAELTLGYRDFDIAVVPVSVTQSTGDVTQIKSTANPDKSQSFEDALSVLGQFEANARAANPEVGLGKFFATGTAAKVLADGFKAKLSNGPSQPLGQPPQPPQPAQPPQLVGPVTRP